MTGWGTSRRPLRPSAFTVRGMTGRGVYVCDPFQTSKVSLGLWHVRGSIDGLIEAQSGASGPAVKSTNSGGP